MSPPPPGRSGLRNRPLLFAGALLVGILLVLLWWLFRAEAPPRVPRDSGGVVAQPQAANESPAVLPQVAAPVAQPLPQAAAADVPAPVPAAAPADARPTGSLLVRVRWSDGTPAVDVGVRIVDGGHLTSTSPVLGTTDARGEARFASVLTGVVFIVTNRGSFTMAEGNGLQVVHLKAGTEQTVDLTLPTGASVAGRVVDEAGRGIEGAAVSVVENENFQGWNTLARTDERGEFALHHVPSQSRLFAWALGFAESAQHDLTAWAPQEMVEIVLVAPCGQVAGTVTDADGRPIRGAALTLAPDGGWGLLAPQTRRIPDGPPPMTVVSDANGRFRFESVPVGRTTLGAHAPRFTLQKQELDVVATSDTLARVVLAPGCVVAGRVTDEAGRPVEGASILYDPSMHRWWGTIEVWSDAQGEYRLEAVPVGALQLIAQHGLIGKDATTVTVAVDAPVTWNPVLSSGTTLQGLVLGRGGEPLAGARVFVRRAGDPSPDPRSIDSSTDAGGVFHLLNVDFDTLTLSIHPEGASFPALVLRDEPRWAGQRVFPVPWSAGAGNVVFGRLAGQIDAASGELGLALGAVGGSGAHLVEGLQPDGRFEVRNLPDGAYLLSVYLSNTEMLAVPLQLAGGGVTDLGDLVVAFGELRVHPTFVGFAGEPPALTSLRARVKARHGSRHSDFLESDGDALVARELPVGDYDLELWGDGVAFVHRSVTVSAGSPQDLLVDIRRGVDFVINLCGPALAALKTCDRVVMDGSGTVLLASPGWLEEGCLEMAACLLPGSYRYEVRAKGGAVFTRDFIVTAAPQQRFDWTVP